MHRFRNHQRKITATMIGGVLVGSLAMVAMTSGVAVAQPASAPVAVADTSGCLGDQYVSNPYISCSTPAFPVVASNNTVVGNTTITNIDSTPLVITGGTSGQGFPTGSETTSEINSPITLQVGQSVVVPIQLITETIPADGNPYTVQFGVDVATTADPSNQIPVVGRDVYTVGSTTPSTNPGGNPTAPVVGMATSSDGAGYWIARNDGTVQAFGDAPSFGSAPTANPIAAIAATSDGKGYWLATRNGQVYAFGDAAFQGDVTVPLNSPIVGMAVDPATGGYWLLGGDGGVFSFNAPFYGSTGGEKLNKPAVGMAATANGGGYYFVAADGGIFSYGNAPFYGSTGNIKLNKPVVGMSIDPTTGGYWMDASDGGIFSFNAPFYGSTGNLTLSQPCVSMSAMPNGGGYRFVAADGGIFDFGDAGFYGSGA
jgi:hypothetical protein